MTADAGMNTVGREGGGGGGGAGHGPWVLLLLQLVEGMASAELKTSCWARLVGAFRE